MKNYQSIDDEEQKVLIEKADAIGNEKKTGSVSFWMVSIGTILLLVGAVAIAGNYVSGTISKQDAEIAKLEAELDAFGAPGGDPSYKVNFKYISSGTTSSSVSNCQTLSTSNGYYFYTTVYYSSTWYCFGARPGIYGFNPTHKPTAKPNSQVKEVGRVMTEAKDEVEEFVANGSEFEAIHSLAPPPNAQDDDFDPDSTFGTKSSSTALYCALLTYYKTNPGFAKCNYRTTANDYGWGALYKQTDGYYLCYGCSMSTLSPTKAPTSK